MKQLPAAPLDLGNKVMQRFVPGGCMQWINPRSPRRTCRGGGRRIGPIRGRNLQRTATSCTGAEHQPGKHPLLNGRSSDPLMCRPDAGVNCYKYGS
jgi:hypothetical protein